MKKGTNHFSRMNYHVKRGMNYLIKNHTLTVIEWNQLIHDFDSRCAYCNENSTVENRGIVPDHIIPASKNGEYVIGNIIPACQRCNDQMGESDWNLFLKRIAGRDYCRRKSKIISHIEKHGYEVVDPKNRLDKMELAEFNAIMSEWEILWNRSRIFRDQLKSKEI